MHLSLRLKSVGSILRFFSLMMDFAILRIVFLDPIVNSFKSLANLWNSFAILSVFCLSSSSRSAYTF